MNSLHWFKSSYSGGSGGNCLEVATPWQTSSHGGGNCVEVAADCALVHVRDSKQPGLGRLDLPSDAWAAFISYARTQPLH